VAEDQRPSVAYDPERNVWMALGLGINSSGLGFVLLVNRSTDGGLTWSNPVVAAQSPGTFWDKTWIACDTWAQSPHYGNCYAQWDDNGLGNQMMMTRSTDGGLTWSAPSLRRTRRGSAASPSSSPTETSSCPIPGTTARFEPSARRTVAPAGKRESSSRARPSIPSRAACAIRRCRRPRSMGWPRVCRLARLPVPYRLLVERHRHEHVDRRRLLDAEYANPDRPVNSTVDHFLPGIGADRAPSGSSARLGLGYYYPVSNCGGSCQLTFGFVSSLEGGATWSAPTQVSGAMNPQWIANTNQGLMVGDYTSTSFTSDGKAHTVFTSAKPPVGRTSCYPTNTGCYQRMAQATFDVTAPPRPLVRVRRDKVRYRPHRRPEDAVEYPTAN
jgi:hypothetical protein